MPEEVFLKLEGIRKSFDGVFALNGIDLEVRPGEIHCLAGGNGCGKSTLIKTVAGVLEPTEGRIWIGGQERKHLRPMDAIRLGIQVIYQDFAVFPNMTVAENIALTGEVKSGALLVDRKKDRSLALETMARIGAEMDPDARLDRLSVAHKQMAAICRAIVHEPKLLILDEPTTALTAREVERLWDILRALKEKGIAILLVDHKLDEVQPIADRLTVIRNGEVISTGRIEEYTHRRFIRDMTGREVENEKYHPEPSGENILTVRGLTRPGAYEDVSFSLDRGDILGLTGLLGSGRSEIGEALFGLCPAESGQILLHGQEIAIRSVRDAVRHEIAYVPEDRLTEGLFLTRSVRENTAAASLRRYLRPFRMDDAAMENDTETYIRRLRIIAPSARAKVSTLSGGNAQKVAIAKWLNTSPKLLILNGPTVGVDVEAKAEIHAILRELAGQGIGIILISDDLAELAENCNRILVVRDHRVIWETDHTATKKELADRLMGVEGGEGLA